MCLDAAASLAERRHRACASCRCRRWDLFDAQDDDVPRRGAAAGRADAVGRGGGVASAGTAGPTTSVGIDRFGASAPGADGARQARLQPRRTSPSARSCAARSPAPTREARHEPAARRCTTSRARARGSTTSSGASSRAVSWPSWSTRASAASPRTRRSSQKAIAGSTDYDDQFGELAVDGSRCSRTYWELVTQRHRRRARHLARLRRERRRRRLRVGRGRARLAHDTAGHRSRPRASLHEQIDQPNLFVKIPARPRASPRSSR